VQTQSSFKSLYRGSAYNVIIKTIPSVHAAISKTKRTTIDKTVLFLYLKTMSTSCVIRQCKKDANFSPQCPYTVQYINVKSLFNRLSSKVSEFNRNKRFLYDKFLNPDRLIPPAPFGTTGDEITPLVRIFG